jgi:hypothetical protein
MNKIVVIDNDFVEASYIEEYKLAQIVWKQKMIPSDMYRYAFTNLLDYTENVSVINFLSDSRNSGANAPDDRKWFQEVAMPRAQKNGLIRGAIVIKLDPFKKYYINTLIKWGQKKVNYELKVFDNIDKGLEWLLSFGDYK